MANPALAAPLARMWTCVVGGPGAGAWRRVSSRSCPELTPPRPVRFPLVHCSVLVCRNNMPEDKALKTTSASTSLDSEGEGNKMIEGPQAEARGFQCFSCRVSSRLGRPAAPLAFPRTPRGVARLWLKRGAGGLLTTFGHSPSADSRARSFSGRDPQWRCCK